ncbi:hypothetical protein [Sporomusa rhizae]|uniref:hypothetical protein n=1 Tax=Sporomusa rhizae TaxID=357999 RepID=UPI00352B33DD
MTQKYQKVKTCTEMALEAGLPCGKGKTRCAQTVALLIPQGRPASTLRDGHFRNGRQGRKQRAKEISTVFLVLPAISEKRRESVMTAIAPVTPVTPGPLPEKAFRRRKARRYSIKKSVLFERSEFTGF